MNNDQDQVHIVKKSKKAMMVLSGRTLFINLVQIASRIFLAKNLTSADFGSFGILQGWLGALIFFTDIGLGDVLVRKSEGIKSDDLSSYFFIRLMLSLVVTLFFVLVYPFIQSHYGFNFDYAGFAWCAAFLIVLDVLAAVPMLVMGHKMEFVKIAQIELFSLLMTYAVQIAISFYVKGPWPFFIGLFAGKMLAVIMSFSMADAIPFPHLKTNLLRLNFNKGAMFQLATILPSLQVIVMPLIMSQIFKVDKIGLIFWIEGLVMIPLAIIYNYNRVAFISLSKFVHDHHRLKEVVSSFLIPMFLGICFVFGLGAVLSKNIIMLIFGEKWGEATLYIHFSCIAFALYSLRYLGLSILSAINEPHVRVFNEIVMIVLTGVLIAIFIPVWGMFGYFYAMILSYAICLLLMLYSIKNNISRAVFRRLGATFISMLLSVFLVFRLSLVDQKYFVAGIVYALCFILLTTSLDKSVFNDLKKIREKIRI